MKEGMWVLCPGHHGIPAPARGKRGRLVRHIHHKMWVVYVPGVIESQVVNFSHLEMS